jgi:hypothetical protein
MTQKTDEFNATAAEAYDLAKIKVFISAWKPGVA